MTREGAREELCGSVFRQTLVSGHFPSGIDGVRGTSTN